MKNKLYYGLFVVYIAVAVIILWVNGVFGGETTNVVNLLINVGFLVIIGVLFMISFLSFWRLNKCTDELVDATDLICKEYKEAGGKSLWNAYLEKKDLFSADPIKTAYGKYRLRAKGLHVKRGIVGNCEIEDYINEDLIDRASMNFFNSGMSGMLTGLGILGTFLGLSIGLAAFNGNDIYAISDNVGGLLGGMKVAFHTSVYGILFSLIFGIVYRSIMSDAYDKLEAFLCAYRQCVVPPSANGDESSAAMLMYQANMSNTLKQLLEMERAENQVQIDGLSKIVDRFIYQMEQQMGQDLRGLGNSLAAVSNMQEKYAVKCQELEQATAALMESQRQLMAAQEELANRVDQQGRVIYETCDDMRKDLSNQLYTYEQMRNLYEE